MKRAWACWSVAALLGCQTALEEGSVALPLDGIGATADGKDDVAEAPADVAAADSTSGGKDAKGDKDDAAKPDPDVGEEDGSLLPKCKGVATVCADLVSLADCQAATNCEWNTGDCTGTPVECDGLDIPTCGTQAGCVWSNAAGHCTGVAYDCTDLTAEVKCQNHQGCAWSGTYCAGTAVPCSTFKAEEPCTVQPGCYWN